MWELRQNTEAIVPFGQFGDKTNGIAPELNLLLANMDEAELLKHGSSTVVDVSGNTWAGIANMRGWYNFTFTAENVDTLGRLLVVFQDDSIHMPVWREFSVVTQQYWDSKYGADRLQVDTREFGGANLALTTQMKADVGDAVCDESLSGHTTPGTLGKAISDIPSGIGTVAVDHNFGGNDALRYIDGAGSGIDNADILVYLKADYDAGNLAAGYVKAKTTTDVNGRWASPCYLDPAIYTIQVYKQGEFGPDSQEITVT